MSSRLRRRATVACLTLEALEDRTVPSVTLGTHFRGLTFDDTDGFSPPDTILAVGPNAILEAVNTTLAVYDKSGHTTPNQSLNDFFAPAGVTAFADLTDPRVVYDELAGRFVVTILEPRFLDVAFSRDTDPADGFLEYRLKIREKKPGGVLTGDFDQVGYNADAYVFTMDMFHSGFKHVQVVSVDKSSIADGAPLTVFHHDLPGLQHETLAPARMHDASAGDPMWFVEEALKPNGKPTRSSLRVVKETSVLSDSPAFVSADVQVTAYKAPPPMVQPGDGSFGSIDGSDGRILSVAFQDGRLLATQAVGLAGLTRARWYEFDTTDLNPLLTQEGTIVPVTGSASSTSYAAIDINSNGDLGVTFMESGPTEAMSMYITGQAAGGTSDRLETPVLVKAGVGRYTEDGRPPFRAGDYGGLAVDPHDGTFWAANEYNRSNNVSTDWGTEIGNFSV